MKKIISFVWVLVFSLFLTIGDCLAEVNENELNNNFSVESKSNNIKNNNNDKIAISKDTYEDIFGDEQAFPFIAGLGKNAAH